MHSNTVFYLPTSNSVARINMGIDGSRRVGASLTATQWLAQQGFATVRPRVNRAVAHDGVVVSFWEYEETVEADRSLTALARLLRELHSCRDIDLDLPVMASPLCGAARALDDHPDAFDGSDRDWLSSEISACERRWEGSAACPAASAASATRSPRSAIAARSSGSLLVSGRSG